MSFSFQQLAVVLVDAPLPATGGRGFMGGLFGPLDEAIANGDDLARLGQLVDQEPGPAADADEPHGHPVVRSRPCRVGHRPARHEIGEHEPASRPRRDPSQHLPPRQTFCVAHRCSNSSLLSHQADTSRLRLSSEYCHDCRSRRRPRRIAPGSRQFSAVRQVRPQGLQPALQFGDRDAPRRSPAWHKSPRPRRSPGR